MEKKAFYSLNVLTRTFQAIKNIDLFTAFVAIAMGHHAGENAVQ